MWYVYEEVVINNTSKSANKVEYSLESLLNEVMQAPQINRLIQILYGVQDLLVLAVYSTLSESPTQKGSPIESDEQLVEQLMASLMRKSHSSDDSERFHSVSVLLCKLI